jgi:PAS domain S-box-containing protein
VPEQPSPQTRRQRVGRPHRTPLQAALWYLAIGSAWVVGSDAIVARYVTSAEGLSQAQTIKGWGFILATAVTIYVVLGRHFRRLERTEDAARRADALARAILDHTSDAVFMKDVEGRYRVANAAAARVIGLSRERILGRTDDELFPRELAARFVAGDRRVLEAEGPLVLEEEIPYPGEAPRTHMTVKTIYRDERGRPSGVIGVSRDISEQKRAAEELRRREEQLRQAQRMEAVGKLAGGIAHDFNNMLTVIKSYGELLAGTLGAGDPRRADLDEIRKAADHAAALTRQLLAFSRQQVLHPAVLDTAGVVADMVRMLVPLLGERVRLRPLLPAEPMWARVDRAQLEQVLVNLAVNARDAMPDGGTLTIAVAPAERADDPGGDEGWVRLEISDTGVGMDEETRARAFEPFFTTKPLGRGTGLGLSTVYGIVMQSGGRIDIRSAPDAGTTFTILLPRAGGAERRDGAHEGVEAPLDGRATILVAEDEDAVRHIARRVLEKEGFHVLTASDGVEAVEVSEHADHIDLLLTDVVMPRMGGRELAERCVRSHPGCRVVFMTGYADDEALLSDPPAPWLLDCVQKPFTPVELAARVRVALGRAADG